MLGRTVMESQTDATLRSYSCPSCNCGSAIARMELNPSFLDLNVGETATVTATGYYQSPCATTQNPPPTTVYPQWINYDSSVISLTGNQAAGVGRGQTTFTASLYSNVVTFNQGCSYSSQQLTAQGSATVPKGCPTGVELAQMITASLLDKTTQAI